MKPEGGVSKSGALPNPMKTGSEIWLDEGNHKRSAQDWTEMRHHSDLDIDGCSVKDWCAK
jgi:hypothetical protein